MKTYYEGKGTGLVTRVQIQDLVVGKHWFWSNAAEIWSALLVWGCVFGNKVCVGECGGKDGTSGCSILSACAGKCTRRSLL